MIFIQIQPLCVAGTTDRTRTIGLGLGLMNGGGGSLALQLILESCERGGVTTLEAPPSGHDVHSVIFIQLNLSMKSSFT